MLAPEPSLTPPHSAPRATRPAPEEEVASTITAYDKDTGEYLGSVELPSTPWGNPITYLHDGKQHILVAVGGRPGAVAELLALALP